MKRFLLLGLCSVLIVGTSLAVEVVLGFGKLTPDGEIVSLLKRCSSKIRAFWYASPYGGGGSASSREWHEPKVFFQDKRANISNAMKIAYFNKLISFKIILENKLLTVKDLERHERLLKYTKGLVNGYYQSYKGFIYIKNGGPIVYAVLVNTDDVSCLENSKIVKDISVNYFPLFNAFLKYVPYYFRPKEYSKYYFFPEVKDADPEELYMMIKKAIEEFGNDPEFVSYYKKFYIETGFYEQRLEFLKHMVGKREDVKISGREDGKGKSKGLWE